MAVAVMFRDNAVLFRDNAVLFGDTDCVCCPELGDCLHCTTQVPVNLFLGLTGISDPGSVCPNCPTVNNNYQMGPLTIGNPFGEPVNRCLWEYKFEPVLQLCPPGTFPDLGAITFSFGQPVLGTVVAELRFNYNGFGICIPTFRKTYAGAPVDCMSFFPITFTGADLVYLGAPPSCQFPNQAPCDHTNMVATIGP